MLRSASTSSCLRVPLHSSCHVHTPRLHPRMKASCSRSTALALRRNCLCSRDSLQSESQNLAWTYPLVLINSLTLFGTCICDFRGSVTPAPATWLDVILY